MSNEKRHRRFALLFTIMTVIFSFAGCANVNKARNSYDRAGEHVRIRMLDSHDLGIRGQTYALANFPDDTVRQNAFMESYNAADPDQTKVSYTGGNGDLNPEFIDVASLAASAVGLAVDVVAKELEKDAERYQMQWRGVHYNDAFWLDDSKQRYRAFEVIRTTTLSDQLGEPATRFVCAIVPSKFEPGLFLLRPVYLEVKATKAKIPDIGKDNFSMEFDFQLSAAVITKNTVKEVVQAASKWPIGGLDLDDEKSYRTFNSGTEYNEQFTAGWFIGVPLPVREQGDSDEGGGAFKLVVSVTETADSKAPEYIQKASGYLKDNKEKVQETVKSFVENNS